MNIMKFALIIGLITLLGCVVQKSEKTILKEIVAIESKKVASDLHIFPFGFGVSDPDGYIREFLVSYISEKRPNVDEARQMIVYAANELISKINTSIESEKIDKKFDLSYFYLSITFEGTDTDFDKISGELAYVVLYEGVVKYKKSEPNSWDYVTVYSEPYEEAYRKVFGSTLL